METAKDVAEFWQKKEEELGEPVLYKSISHTYLAELPDTFGILFASAGSLVYEYSKGGRRSILDVILSRKKDEELSETVLMPREEIRRVAIVDACSTKQWLRRQLSPAQVLAALAEWRPTPLKNIFCGSHLVVCSQRTLMVCDTPENRQWLQFLSRK
ncbi:MAG: hypothetical protein JW820_07890 [Spirochaetales bacterium]|nr:hypothetical protein [Spirochaetales bacterium]